MKAGRAPATGCGGRKWLGGEKGKADATPGKSMVDSLGSRMCGQDPMPGTVVHDSKLASTMAGAERTNACLWLPVSRSVWHILLHVPRVSSCSGHERMLSVRDVRRNEDPLPDPIRHPGESSNTGTFQRAPTLKTVLVNLQAI